MSNYIGVRCPVCTKKFAQSDDIVVCPICGAPHHRDCYKQNSACAFASDHISGKEWRAPAPEIQSDAPPKSENTTVCPVCSSPNPSDVIFCQICGKRMSEIPPQVNMPKNANSWGFPGIFQELDSVSLMYGGLSPDEKIEGESVRDLAVYIGENSAYYLPKFKSMNETSRTLSFNFSALIFSFLYFFNRKMYMIGGIMLAFFLIGAIPGFMQSRELLPQYINFYFSQNLPVNQLKIDYYQSLINATSTINFLICLIVSFCANRFYYMKAMSDIKKIRHEKSEPRDEIAYTKTLSAKGGTSKAAIIIVICSYIAFYFVLCGVMAYQYIKAGGTLG